MQDCCETSWKGMVYVYHPRSNLSWNKSGSCKLREYWLIGWTYAGVTPYVSLVAKQIWKRATCTDFVAKSRTTLYLLRKLLGTCSNLIVAKQLWTWVVKRVTLLFNSFCSNVAKQRHVFLLPVSPYLSSLPQPVSIHICISVCVMSNQFLVRLKYLWIDIGLGAGQGERKIRLIEVAFPTLLTKKLALYLWGQGWCSG